MKKLLLACAFLLCSQLIIAQSQKEKDIIKLLRITGSGDLGVQVMNNMIGSFKQTYPDVPTEFWDEIMKEVNPGDLVDMVVPVYDKYYTHEDILGLIEFYESDLGQRMVQLLPSIMQESMSVGREWGEDLAKKVVKRMERRGY